MLILTPRKRGRSQRIQRRRPAQRNNPRRHKVKHVPESRGGQVLRRRTPDYQHRDCLQTVLQSVCENDGNGTFREVPKFGEY